MGKVASIVCNSEYLQVSVGNKVYTWDNSGCDMGGDGLSVLLSDLGFEVELVYVDKVA